jgi:hypothetical protein
MPVDGARYQPGEAYSATVALLGVPELAIANGQVPQTGSVTLFELREEGNYFPSR